MVSKIQAYFQLTKPGIIFGNAVTGLGGFTLASGRDIHLSVLAVTLLGLSFIIASGCVFNNYIDRNHDGKMKRTQNRPLVTGAIQPRSALLFGSLLLVSGIIVFEFFGNFLALLACLFGFVIYLFFYSFLKYRTVHATLIGSVAGAIPPVVGYCGASGALDGGAMLIFLLIAFWQLPHFYAIAVFRLEDYREALIPVLPAIKGLKATKVHMLLYIFGFLAVSLLLPFFDYVSKLDFIFIALLGLTWIIFCLKGFHSQNEKKWAKGMFIYSLIVVLGICLIIPFTGYL